MFFSSLNEIIHNNSQPYLTEKKNAKSKNNLWGHCLIRGGGESWEHMCDILVSSVFIDTEVIFYRYFINCCYIYVCHLSCYLATQCAFWYTSVLQKWKWKTDAKHNSPPSICQLGNSPYLWWQFSYLVYLRMHVELLPLSSILHKII